MMFFGGWMVIFWVVIIGLVVWGGTALTKRGYPSANDTRKRDPLEITRERYAREEISKEEFDEIRKKLSRP